MSWTLPKRLPHGQLITPQRWDASLGAYLDDPDATPVMWVSDKLRTDVVSRWWHLFERRDLTGLWPLLLRGLGPFYDDVGHDRPWRTGELRPATPAELTALDLLSPAQAAELLETLWRRAVDKAGLEKIADVAIDYGDGGHGWPGMAPRLPLQYEPDECAAELAERCRPAMLALVPAHCGAQALATCGWLGTMGHASPVEVAAVLRSWEERFGVTVVEVGFATLLVSVAAPPNTYEEAVAIAAEHHAFCPDGIDRSPWPGASLDPSGPSLRGYAQALIGATEWHFWWD
jgi:hypothetical protein